MLSVSACKISIPPFSASPGPCQEEEALQAAEEIERLSAEAALFSLKGKTPRSTSVLSLDTSPTLETIKSDTCQIPRTVSNVVLGEKLTPRSMRQTTVAEVDEISFDLSCFEAVRLNYLQRSRSPTMTFRPRKFSFPPAHRVRVNDTSCAFPSPERTQDSFPQLSPPNIACLARMKFSATFIVQTKKSPPARSQICRKRPESTLNSIALGDTTSLCAHLVGNASTPARPVVRRKPVPKFTDEPVRNSSFMLFASMDSFPILPHDNKDALSSLPPPTLVKAIQRSDQIKQYSLRHFLSQGAQGKVYLATTGDPTKISAIKVISKLTVESFRTLLQEQRLLKRIKGHQFALNMVDSFHDSENFYLVTDYYPGGDLAHLLYKLGVFETDMARFYITELIVAVRFLHSKSIIHRDLKPGNILIKSDGHICLVDFGLCKDFNSVSSPDCSSDRLSHCDVKPRVSWGPTTNGFAGTLVYMSPQAINQDWYSYETDWWSMGIILYELLQGDTPWTGSDIGAVIKKIRREPLGFRRDLYLHEHARDFLEKILQKRVECRLPSRNYENHIFFSSIEFRDVEKGILTPPYIPCDQGETLAARTLKDIEKIYVGRPYDSDVDPFPEYNYDYIEQSPSVDLEQLAEYAKDIANSLRSSTSRSQGTRASSPRPGLRRAVSYSGDSEDAREVAKGIAPSNSFLDLPVNASLGFSKHPSKADTKLDSEQQKWRRSAIPAATSSLFKLSTAFCRSILQPRGTLTATPPLHTRPPAPIFCPVMIDASTGSLSLSTAAAAINTLPLSHSTKPCRPHPSTPYLSPPLPSMLTVSSVIRTNSLFSVNLTEGCTTHTTLPSCAGLTQGLDVTSSSSCDASGSEAAKSDGHKQSKSGQAGTSLPCAGNIGFSPEGTLPVVRRFMVFLGRVLSGIQIGFAKCRFSLKWRSNVGA